MNAVAEPSSDVTANEISGISGTWADPTYDAAGNVISGPKAGDETIRLHFVYDGWNRLVQVKADDAGQPGSTIATYGYDGLGRRISNNPDSGTVDYYYNEQYQVVEVRKNGDADAYEQYVYSQRYIDAPVMVYRDTNTDGTVDQKLYVAQDANFNVTATVNGDTRAVVNRFVYTPYSQRTVLSATWTAGTSDFALGHQGLMLDSETGMYYNRARFYHPTLGRFIQRDPLGYVDGGSLYENAAGRPTVYRDPFGLWSGVNHGRLSLNERQIRNIQLDLERRLANERWRFYGHGNFVGGDVFDWELEDNDPRTRPWPGGKPENHFQPLEVSELQVAASIGTCDAEGFQRAVHRGQDYFSHYEPGYRWAPELNLYGHAFRIEFIDTIFGPIGFIRPYPLDVDDAGVHMEAFMRANEWTARQLDQWYAHCHQECDGKWAVTMRDDAV